MRALVTGGTGGLGTSICRELARTGHTVVVGYHSRHKEAGALVEELGRFDVDATALCFDVTSPTHTLDAVGEAAARMGGLDILVNGAARNVDGLIGDIGPDAMARVYAVNVMGVMHCIQSALPWLILSGRGRIVNFSSVLAAQSIPGTSIYSGTKGAIEALTRALASELGSKSVTVNAVAPGFVDAGLGRRPLLAIGDGIRTLVPARRPGTPEEIAAVVVFLASEGASYINGAVIPVDGGLLAGSGPYRGPTRAEPRAKEPAPA